MDLYSRRYLHLHRHVHRHVHRHLRFYLRGSARRLLRWRHASTLRFPSVASSLLCLVSMVCLGAYLGSTGGCSSKTIDLRTDQDDGDGDLSTTCASGTRENPETHECETCIVTSPPAEDVCPCGFSYRAADFPYCEGDRAFYECRTCNGDITDCRSFDATRGVTSDCMLLFACCAELARDAASASCCASDAEVNCVPTENLGEYEVRCMGKSCCVGMACPNGDSDCSAWQTCDAQLGSCVPACAPLTETCSASCDCKQSVSSK